MPAHLVEELDDNGQAPAARDLSSLEAKPAEAPAATTQTQPDVLQGDAIPEKYRGKSAQELLDIVTNQESHIGRQGQELGDLRGQVGTLRGLVDKSLDLRETGNVGRQVVTEDELSDNDFITQPKDAVSKTVQRETAGQQDRLAALEQQAAATDFANRHPTAQTDVVDESFIEFVKKSPVRQRLAHQAFNDGTGPVDFDSASELWSLYEDYQSLRPADSTTEAASSEAASSPAETVTEPAKEVPAMVTTGSSGDTGQSTKPKYSQAALNRLQVSDPDTYWADDTQAKIAQARAEGRVVDDA